MIFCDQCNKVVSHSDHCVYEQHDFHSRCLETVRAARLIIDFVEWYDANGILKLDAASAAHDFFVTWLERRGVSTMPKPEDPRPPLPFPRR